MFVVNLMIKYRFNVLTWPANVKYPVAMSGSIIKPVDGGGDGLRSIVSVLAQYRI